MTAQAVLITSAIEVLQRGMVSVRNVIGAFLQTEMDDHVIVIFWKETEEMLVKSRNPKMYKKYVQISRK